jgi:hypothetical protein
MLMLDETMTDRDISFRRSEAFVLHHIARTYPQPEEKVRLVFPERYPVIVRGEVHG